MKAILTSEKKYMNIPYGADPFPVAVGCIVFGFDGAQYKLLLIQRGLAPEKGKWSLVGEFLQAEETLDEAAYRILENLTGMRSMYLEQMRVFSKPARDPGEGTVTVTYVALIDINKSQDALSWYYNAAGFH